MAKKEPPITKPSPVVIAKDDEREKKWRAEDDFRLASRYKELEKDRERMREMKKHARAQVKMAKGICGD